jgi:glycosyltransferase involved in cell wall biosynthesis
MRFRSRLYDLSGLAHNPTIIAISTAVQQRITSFYNKDSALLFPPAIKDELLTQNFKDSAVNKIFGQKYFSHVSRIESYKNIDLLVDLTVRHTLPENIVIMGAGPYLAMLKKKLKRNYGNPKITTETLCNETIKLEKYSTIYLTDAVSEQVKFTILAGANAFFSLNDEDFGITKVESLAVGTPVIAYAAGGSLDIIKHGMNGVFFEEPTTDSLYAVLQLHRILSYDRKKIMESAEPFTVSAFHHKLETLTNA